MEEKILIKSEHRNIKRFINILLTTMLIISIGVFAIMYIDGNGIDECLLNSVFTFLFSWLVLGVIKLILSKYELTVTDKRVYGKTTFGKRVDLPVDSISAVGTSFMQGIDIGTSSGRIKFKFVKNQNEIHSTLSKLIMERQEKETKSTVVENIISTSNADELKKFKELLDSGIISQEEFDAKKKQLLGL